jgi:predicted MFS family arabinose efflux permease
MEPTKKEKKALNTYAKYSSIAFQMLGIMLAGVFGGRELDRWLEMQFPVFTLVLTIGAVILAIYFVIKDLLRK